MRTHARDRSHRRSRRVLPYTACVVGALIALPGFTAVSAAVTRAATQAQPGDESACPATNPPNELTLVGGTPQTARLDMTFADPLQVMLVNTNGCPVSPVAGTPVTFTAPASGASASFSASGADTLTVGADDSGNVRAGALTANDTPGSYTIIAQSAYGAVSFSLTNTAAGIPATVTAVSPTRQRAIAGSRYKDPLSVRVLDAGGRPISGVTVTFTLENAGSSSAGGSSNGSDASATFAGGGSTTTAVTGSDGVASSPSFVANQSAGSFVAFASVAHVSQPTRFQLVNQSATGLRLTRIGSARRIATVGRAYRARLRVRVRGANGRPMIGLRVTFTLATGAGSGSGQATLGGSGARATFPGGIDQVTETTNASGIAVSPRLTANTTAGIFTAAADTTAGNATVAFRLVNRSGPPASLAPGAGATQATAVGTRFLIPLAVTVTDAFGNVVPDVPVTFAAPAAGASGRFHGHRRVTVRTDRRGIAVAPRLAANELPGGYIVIATSDHARPVAFALVNRRP